MTFRAVLRASHIALGLVSLVGLSLSGCVPAPPAEAGNTAVQPTSPAPGPNAAPPAVNATDAQGKPLPPGGVAMLPAGGVSAFNPSGSNDLMSVEKVNVPAADGQPFTEAYRLTTKKRPENVWTVQFSGTTLDGVKQGDVLLATFYLRTVKGQAETGEARTEFVFERGADPYTKSAEYPVSIPAKGWKRYDVPFTAREDLPKDLVRVHFRMGYDPQAFEVGGISLTKWADGSGVSVKDLPRTVSTYAGMDEAAAWRKAAEARIDKIRKADLRVTVVDASGKPIPGAKVSVRMTRHAFPFGSAVAADGILGTSPDDEQYRKHITEMFNRVVMENDLKWGPWEQNPDRAKRAVAWLRQHNIEVRGHNLVWPGWQNLPGDIRGLATDKAKLAKRIDDHIRQEAGAMKGQLVEWDVVNEPYTNHALQDILGGRDSLIHWFKLAHEADPKPVLFLNDYPPLDGGDPNNPHLNNFYDNISFLKAKGAPIGGIGFQCHIGGNVIPPGRVLAGLDRFGKFGLPIAITEFDINTQDEKLQAAYMRDFLTAAFSHPAVDSVIMWGFWAGRHWLPDAALFRRDWTIRPVGQAWMDLVKGKWWTKTDGTTNAQGAYATRAFLGDYTVTVTAPNGKTATLKFPLTKAGARPTIKL